MNSKDKMLDDFNIIKEAINKTKNNSQWIKKIFLMIGIMSTLLLATQFTINLFISNYSVIGIISPLLNLSVYTFTTILFMRISRKENRHTNIFFRLFISILLLIYVMLPITFLLIRTFMVFSSETNNEILIMFQQMNELLKVFLFSISLLIVSYINENRIYFILSILNIFVYLLLLTINNSVYMMQAQMVILHYSSLYSGIVTSLGYILLQYLIRNVNEQ